MAHSRTLENVTLLLNKSSTQVHAPWLIDLSILGSIFSTSTIETLGAGNEHVQLESPLAPFSSREPPCGRRSLHSRAMDAKVNLLDFSPLPNLKRDCARGQRLLYRSGYSQAVKSFMHNMSWQSWTERIPVLLGSERTFESTEGSGDAGPVLDPFVCVYVCLVCFYI